MNAISYDNILNETIIWDSSIWNFVYFLADSSDCFIMKIQIVCVCDRNTRWTAIFVSIGATGDCLFSAPSSRCRFPSRCWNASGGRTPTSTTAKTLTCTPSPCPTNCSALVKMATFCIPCGKNIANHQLYQSTFDENFNLTNAVRY